MTSNDTKSNDGKLDELEVLRIACRDARWLHELALNDLARRIYAVRHLSSIYAPLAHKLDSARELFTDVSNELAERLRYLTAINSVNVPADNVSFEVPKIAT